MLSDWSSADYFSNISSLILFVIAWWLGRRQGLIIDRIGVLIEKEASVLDNVNGLTQDVHRLQTAVAALQVREKIGVIHQAASSIQTRPHAAVTLVSDCISVLDVYPFAPEVLQRDYIKALDTAFTSLHGTSNLNGKPRQLDLAIGLLLYAKGLSAQREHTLVRSLVEPIARCSACLHELGESSREPNTPFATEIFESKVKLLEHLLSINEEELILKLETEVFHFPQFARGSATA